MLKIDLLMVKYILGATDSGLLLDKTVLVETA